MKYISNCECSYCNNMRKQEFTDNYMKITSYYFILGVLIGFLGLLLLEIFIYFMLTGGF